MLIDRAPQPVFHAVDRDDDFIKMPFAIELTSRSAVDVPRILLPELLHPSTDRLVGDDDPAFHQQVFNHAQAERKPKVELDRMSDYTCRETMTAKK